MADEKFVDPGARVPGCSVWPVKPIAILRWVWLVMVLVVTAACSGSGQRSGPLATLAEAVMPADAPTTCLDVVEPPSLTATRNTACQVHVGDTTVTIVKVRGGDRVVRVTRLWQPGEPLQVAYDRAVTALSDTLGAGRPICIGSTRDPAHRWQRDSMFATLAQITQSAELELTFRLGRPAFAESCGSSDEPASPASRP